MSAAQPAHTASGAATASDASSGAEGALVPALLFTTATAAALDLVPLSDPASRALLAHAALFLALGMTALAARGGVLALAAAAAAALAGWPSFVVVALGAAGALVVWHRADRRRIAVATAATVATACAAVSLERSLGPGFLTDVALAPLAALFDLLGRAPVAGDAYGLAALPAALAGVLASGAPRAARAVGIALVVSTLAVARVEESAWIALASWSVGPALAWVAAREVRTTERSARPARTVVLPLVAWTALVAGAIVLGIAATDGRAPRSGPCTVAILGARHGSFERLPLPSVELKSASAEPRFGAFRARLEARGVEAVDVIDPAELRGRAFDAILAINFHGDAAHALVEPVRAAVRAGADLLVLGDHTDLFGQRAPTNALLADTGIALEFDSAVPLPGVAAWRGGLAAGRDPLFGPHRDGIALQLGVGCSLSVAAPAHALLTGPGGFLDKGVADKPGGLDDLARGADERVGGFALAASSSLGAGRVLVLGDTSCAQDTALLDGAPFAERLIGWLAGGGRAGDPWFTAGGLGIAAALVLWIAVLAVPRSALVLAGVALVLSGAEWAFEHRMRARLAHGGALERLLELPASLAHGPEPGVRLDPLVEQAASLGWTVAVAGDAPADREAAGIVLVDPRTPIDDEQARRWLARVERGGRLVLFVGERGASTAAPLLDSLGLSIGMPLGTGHRAAWTGALAGIDELAPAFSSSFEIRGPGLADTDVIATCFGRPVAVRGRLGSGQWLLVGDGGLPLDRHADPLRGGKVTGARTLERLLTFVLGEA